MPIFQEINNIDKIYWQTQLPKEFQELEYIESSGTQYIDTGVIGNLNTRAEIDVQSITASSIKTLSPFGDLTVNTKAVSVNLSMDISGRNSRFGNKEVTATGVVTAGNRYLINIDKNRILLNGNSLGNFNTTTDFTTDGNLYICRVNGLGTQYYDSTNRFFSTKIYDGSTLIRNFIPAKRTSDGEVGLYDTVNGQFYTNQGTGTFTAGHKKDIIRRVYSGTDLVYGLPTNFQEVEYIESTGTQYVDTGFKPNQDSGIEVDYKMTSMPNQYNAPYGTRVGNTNQMQVIHTNTAPRQYDFRYGTGTYTSNVDFVTNRNKVKQDKNVCYVNGQQIQSFTKSDWGTNYSMYLFCTNSEGTSAFRSNMQLFGSKLYDNDTLIRNFIPAKAKTASKNLLPTVNGTTQTINGITFTKNADGTVTANGTATADANYYTNGYTYTTFKAGSYTISDGVPDEHNNTYFTYVDGSPNNNSTVYSPSFTIDQETNMRTRIVIRAGQTLNNIVFKVQIEEGSTATAYEPYYEANEAGLYDLVNRKFYTNAGTGSFIAGGEV